MISTNGCDLPFYGLGFVDMKGKCLDIKLESFSSVTWEDWRLFLTYVTILTNLGNSFTFSGRFIPPLCDFPSQLLWMYVKTHLNIFSPWRYHGYRIGVCSFTSLSHPCRGLVLGSSFLFFPHSLSSGHLGLSLMCCDQNKGDPLPSPPYVNQRMGYQDQEEGTLEK